MKANLQIYLTCLWLWPVCTPCSFADTLVLSNGSTVSGTVLQTNGDDILLLTGYAAFNFSRSNTKDIEIGPVETAQPSNSGRIPDCKEVVLSLSKQSWATNLTPIPATVIDKGILRNVPYSSFRCGEDYEVNVYGDLEHPAGFEIGIYRKLLGSKSAQANCMTFISNLLSQSADIVIVQGLNLMGDLKTSDNLTFEISPPTAEDAYNGWWISVYSESQLNLARASDEEMKQISVSKADVAKQSNQASSSSAWSAKQLKLARPSSPQTFTFTTKSGEVITNAEVVRIFVEGVSLIWRSGSSMGVVELADLPEDLQIRFGYDPAKAAAAEELEKQKKAQWQQQAAASQQAQGATAVQSSAGYPQFYSSGSDYSSGGGSVYVHGYYRRNGTYVHSYYRSR
ncbi:MAG TPA: hypothetical protein VFY06_15990 [Verrucomicrobiae bacterium]|nr:hypothetical protein [Verrucomicrobiae bacterium]